MGFFSGLRRKIKKIIPKEVRPFIPYAAAMIPGLQGLGGLGPVSSRFLTAAAARGLTDDEASIKDIARAGIFAAAPKYLDTKIQGLDKSSKLGEFLKTAGDAEGATSIAQKVSDFADPKGFKQVATTLGATGGIDAGIKAAELNKDALEKYNADLAAQGIGDRKARRAAIRGIYEGTGTWDMDEVDSMLDTYGYRTGGRVGYAMGDQVLTQPSSMDSRSKEELIQSANMADEAYNKIFTRFMERFPGIATGEETIEEMIAMLQAEEIPRENLGIIGTSEAMDMITPESVDRSTRRIMRGDTGFGDVGSMDFSDPDIDVGDYGQSIGKKNGGRIGYEDGDAVDGDVDRILKRRKKKTTSMEDLIKDTILDKDITEGDGEEKNTKSKRRTRDDDLEDNINMMSKSYKIMYPEIKAQPIRPLTFAKGGGVMDAIDVNMMEQIDTPRGDMIMDVNSMEEIKGQTAGPDWYMERIQNLEFLFGDELTDEEIADIAYDSDKYYEKVGYDPMKTGGRVGRSTGGSMMAGADSSLFDAYEIYRFDMMEQGLEPMSIEEFRNQAISEGQMASGDMDVPIQDLADEFEITFGRPANSLDELKDFYKQKYEFNGDVSMMEESQRTMAAEGGLMNLGGKEMDLRGGGFVPMGRAERADDVPARLSKNEFVMTADAVRAAGGGSVQKGADLMYDQMKQLEGQA